MVAAGAELDSFRESHAKEMTDEQVVQKLPEELRRQSLSGTLPVSLHTLRVSLVNQQLPLEFCVWLETLYHSVMATHGLICLHPLQLSWCLPQ